MTKINNIYIKAILILFLLSFPMFIDASTIENRHSLTSFSFDNEKWYLSESINGDSIVLKSKENSNTINIIFSNRLSNDESLLQNYSKYTYNDSLLKSASFSKYIIKEGSYYEPDKKSQSIINRNIIYSKIVEYNMLFYFEEGFFDRDSEKITYLKYTTMNNGFDISYYMEYNDDINSDFDASFESIISSMVVLKEDRLSNNSYASNSEFFTIVVIISAFLLLGLLFNLYIKKNNKLLKNNFK